MDVLVDGEIVLYGTVGDSYWGTGFTSRDVLDALAQVGRGTDITVRINSGGGYAHEGVSIFNALKAHRGKVTVRIDGLAASAASVIAMAGADVVMRAGALMMIHDPSVWTSGNASEHERSLRYLEVSADGMADIYAEKSGRTPEECRADMKAEIWLNGADAVEQGYADRVEEQSAAEATAFDYRLYQHAPERLVALAAAKGWKLPARATADATAPIPPKPHKETPMATETQAAIVPAITVADVDKARADTATSTRADAKAIIDLCASAGVAAMAAVLVGEGVTLAEAQKRVEGAKEITAAVDLARKSCPAITADQADKYLSAGLTIEGVRADLYLKMTATQSPEIVTAHQPGDATAAGGGKDGLNPSAIYAGRAKARAERGPAAR